MAFVLIIVGNAVADFLGYEIIVVFEKLNIIVIGRVYVIVNNLVNIVRVSKNIIIIEVLVFSVKARLVMDW